MRKMRKRVLLISRGAAVIGLASTSQGQNLIVCPGKGQSAEQQNRDRYECHSSAVRESGFDPSQAQPAAPSPYGPTPLRGAMRGATVGAIGGAIGDNAGKGAAIGAGTGGLIGGMRRRN